MGIVGHKNYSLKLFNNELISDKKFSRLRYTSTMLLLFNNNIGFSSLYSCIVCLIVYSVCGFETPTLITGRLCSTLDTGKIPMGTCMPVTTGTNMYHPWMLNPLTASRCQVAFELYCMLNVLLASIDLVKPSTLTLHCIIISYACCYAIIINTSWSTRLFDIYFKFL